MVLMVQSMFVSVVSILFILLLARYRKIVKLQIHCWSFHVTCRRLCTCTV